MSSLYFHHRLLLQQFEFCSWWFAPEWCCHSWQSSATTTTTTKTTQREQKHGQHCHSTLHERKYCPRGAIYHYYSYYYYSFHILSIRYRWIQMASFLERTSNLCDTLSTHRERRWNYHTQHQQKEICTRYVPLSEWGWIACGTSRGIYWWVLGGCVLSEVPS